MAGLPSIYEDLSSQWLKDVYLLGVDLTLDDGSPYPPALFERNIRAAVALAEHTFQISIDPIEVESEKHDLFEGDRKGWYSFQLDHRPILEVTAARMHYGSSPPVTIPLDWVKITAAEHGQINLLPSASGSQGGFLFSSAQLWSSGARHIPAYFEFDYVAGLNQETGSLTLSGSTPVQTTLGRPMPSSDYDVGFTLPDYAPYVVSRTGTNFVVKLATAPPGPITYEWTVPTNGRGSVTFGAANDPITITLPRKTLDLTYKVNFTAPDFLPQLTAKKPGSFTTKMGLPPAWDVPFSWRASRVPADIKHWIGMRASMGPLNIAGDLVGGVAIASSSIGVDGFSQSINTTSSAENGGFSARIREFERELPPLTSALKSKYRRMLMVVI